MNKIVLILSLVVFSNVPLLAQDFPDGVYTQLAQYTGLQPDYINALPAHIHNLMSKKEFDRRAIENSACIERFEAKYLSHITDATEPAEVEFESGFISIESTFCFRNTSPENVMTLFLDREFQAQSVSTIKESYQKGELICEKTSAPTIGNSHYCYQQKVIPQDQFILGLSLNVWNDSVNSAPAPVYFREVMATARQLQGMTEFRSAVMVRAVKLTFFQKLFAQNAIASEQRSIYEKMKQKLQN